MTDKKTPPAVPAKRKRKGFLDPYKVKSVAFYVIAICIIISVVGCIMAIWDFAQDDTLWRTIATCVVIAGGCGLFSFVNMMMGSD